MNRTDLETTDDRAALVADAGMAPVSVTSVAAGVLVAYGAFVIIGAIIGALIASTGIEADVLSTDYEQLGIAGGLAAAGVLFISYLFGGYVAGRMARRRGMLHGALVFVLGVLIVTAVAALTSGVADPNIGDVLRELGVPTTADQYGNALTVAGIAAVIAAVLGSILGGKLGEMWHGKLLTRAVDPSVGTEAEVRAGAQHDLARSEETRTDSFRRTRAASPRRARRADRDAAASQS
ncbi:MAG: YrzE family protein [Acidimicrobiales bacterium]